MAVAMAAETAESAASCGSFCGGTFNRAAICGSSFCRRLSVEVTCALSVESVDMTRPLIVAAIEQSETYTSSRRAVVVSFAERKFGKERITGAAVVFGVALCARSIES